MVDKRNSIAKYPILIKNLREIGFKDDDLIPFDYVLYNSPDFRV